MKEINKDRPRAPRDWWEKTLFALLLVLPSTIYPFAKAFKTTVTPLGTSLVVTAPLIILLLLSIFRHIGPTFVVKREAAYQNRHAAEFYSIPVTFDAEQTFVPGCSRLRATRSDNSQTVDAWKLQFDNGRQAA